MHNLSSYTAERCQEISGGDGETRGTRLGNPRTLSTASGSSIIENDYGQSTTTTKGVDNLEASFTDVACLAVVDDPGIYSASGGISYRDSSLDNRTITIR